MFVGLGVAVALGVGVTVALGVTLAAAVGLGAAVGAAVFPSVRLHPEKQIIVIPSAINTAVNLLLFILCFLQSNKICYFFIILPYFSIL